MSLFEGRNEVPVTKKGLFMVPVQCLSATRDDKTMNCIR